MREALSRTQAFGYWRDRRLQNICSGVDGAEDVRVRTDRHSPAARVDTLAHGGLSPARPAPSTGARTCKRPSGRAF
jgi:hypothetical protein